MHYREIFDIAKKKGRRTKSDHFGSWGDYCCDHRNFGVPVRL